VAKEIFAGFGEMAFRRLIDQLFANVAKANLYGLVAVSV
jgi:hypothetical protein